MKRKQLSITSTSNNSDDTHAHLNKKQKQPDDDDSRKERLLEKIKNIKNMSDEGKTNFIGKIQKSSEKIQHHLFLLFLENKDHIDEKEESFHCLELSDKSDLYFFHGIYHFYITENETQIQKYLEMSIHLEKNPLTIFYLALFHQDFTKDYVKMEENYEILIQLNDTTSMNNMGFHHQYTTLNYEQMKKYYQMGIKLGCTSAMFNMGVYYMDQKEYDKMEEFLEMAMKFGDVESFNRMGLYHQDIRKDYAKMIEYYQMSIKLGSTSAMFNMGVYYMDQKEYDKMQEYFEMAIQLNHCKSMIQMGHYHQKTTKKYDQMKRYYQMAIDLGDENAMFYMGEFHQDIEKDYVKMEEYYHMAIKQKQVEAMYNMGLYHQEIDKNYTKMVEFYEMAIKILNHTGSMNNLGFYYQHIMKNYVKAKDYYQMAIRLGRDRVAMFNMAYYYKELGNHERMIEYCVLSINLNHAGAFQLFVEYIFKKNKKNLQLKYMDYILEKYPLVEFKKHKKVDEDLKSYIKTLQEMKHKILAIETIDLENFTCITCQANVRNMLFLPCKHSSMCFRCCFEKSEILEKCPICRSKIEKMESITWS
jgi:TPR repeat protein